MLKFTAASDTSGLRSLGEAEVGKGPQASTASRQMRAVAGAHRLPRKRYLMKATLKHSIVTDSAKA
jgi:hypothetical protein